MAFPIVWSPEAIEDVNAIAEFIGRDSSFYAESVVSKIVDIADTLSSYPESGRMVPERKDSSLRERFIYNYRLIYRVDKDHILIIAIIHGKQKLTHIDARFE